ncbi:MAG: YabP/YqfC family sporulation protein [Clostridia bacterium]|nr:YabP/YqfC family sporulation protein [Clostridia bacterium]
MFESKKKGNKFNFFMPDAINKEMLSGANIQLFSNKEIIVDGCSKVSDFNADYLKLKITKGYLIINGNNFNIVNFEEGIIDVTGDISSLEFCL